MTDEQLLAICLDYIILSRTFNKYDPLIYEPDRNSLNTEAGQFVMMYCMSKYTTEEPTIEEIVDDLNEMLDNRMTEHACKNEIIEPEFNEDGTISYKLVK